MVHVPSLQSSVMGGMPACAEFVVMLVFKYKVILTIGVDGI